ncbi:MAG: FAD-binding protein [Pseudonocardiaceae bacterium]
MKLSRRAFLRAAGLGASAATLTACTPGVLVRTAQTTAEGAPPDWAKLRTQLAGPLFLPSDPGYATAKLAYNPLFDGHQPAAIAHCDRPEDVQACVDLAAATPIAIAARGGGHSYAGYSTPDQGLVVDLSGLTGIDVRQDGTAVVGAGARLIDVYATLAGAGRCLPGGSCPTVGIAGLTLGGGLGVLTRKYGLTCDRLASAQVVTPDGGLRTAAPDSEPDLFWALRGGGGGNFGIVTSFTFSTVPAPELAVFQLHFPAGSVADVLGAWQRFTTSAPDELWSTLAVSGGDPPICRLTGCYVGTTDGLNPLLDDLVGRAGVPPTDRYVQAKGYLDAMRYFGGCSTKSIPQCHPDWNGPGQLPRQSFVATSRVLPSPINDPGRIAALMTGRSGMDLLIDSLGGAVSRIGAGDTAFPYRSALATVQIYQSASAATAPAARRSVGAVRTELGALLGENGYVNYIDPELPGWASAYYGSNLPRLRQVAEKYDPNAMFAFAQGLTRA